MLWQKDLEHLTVFSLRRWLHDSKEEKVMPIMKEGRIPLAQLVKDDKQEEQSLAKITMAMNDMLARHDNPEDVIKMVTSHARKWASEWSERGVGKGKGSFTEFMNSGIGGFDPHRKSALLNVKRRRQAKIIAPGSS